MTRLFTSLPEDQATRTHLLQVGIERDFLLDCPGSVDDQAPQFLLGQNGDKHQTNTGLYIPGRVFSNEPPNESYAFVVANPSDQGADTGPHRVKKRYKILLWVGLTVLSLVALAVAWWVHRFEQYTPAEVRADIRAAIAARNAPRRVERFLELRYGSLTEATNRQKAFLDFFNPGHIEGLQIIVRHTPDEMRQANTDAMAEWVAQYRRTMTPDEKQALGAFFRSDAGRATLQQATGHYMRQDARYRAGTAPVIRELMTTVAAVQKP